LIKKGAENKEIEIMLEMNKAGFSVSQIAKIVKKSEQEVNQIIENQSNK
jgi:hypothetical protein